MKLFFYFFIFYPTLGVEGDGKRNILLGWPTTNQKTTPKSTILFVKPGTAGGRGPTTFLKIIKSYFESLFSPTTFKVAPRSLKTTNFSDKITFAPGFRSIAPSRHRHCPRCCHGPKQNPNDFRVVSERFRRLI